MKLTTIEVKNSNGDLMAEGSNLGALNMSSDVNLVRIDSL